MKIVKIFNNNSVAALTSDDKELILTGSGIGFQATIGEDVKIERIEKTYLFQDYQKDRFKEALHKIPTIYFEITDEIVNRASLVLDTEFSGEIYVAMSDHLSFAIKRAKENITLPNIILNETKIIYRKAYEVGLWGLELIKEKTGVQLNEDEAGYIALHLINFSLNENFTNAAKVATFTKDVLDVIRKTMKRELLESSLEFVRISTHLKYLAERIFCGQVDNMKDTTADIRDLLKEDSRLALCINQINKMIYCKYNYHLTPDEQTYLCIHIKKNLD